MEFHADLVLPYRDDFQSSPMHGQFVLVQLEHEREAVFGRITTIAAQGRLVSPIGEDYAVRAVRDRRPIPDELRDQYLKYKVNIRILGVIRREGDKLLFVPSHRRLPHVGAQVAFLSPELLAEVANATSAATGAAELGFLAFGEFIYAGDDPRVNAESWMVLKSPPIVPRFQIDKLLARRSFVFARAGFGKSNLVKLLFSSLYAADPYIRRRDDRNIPVGTVIFDPDGEYFWPAHGKPALCDVPHLTDRLVVFTNKRAPSALYQSFVADGIKLDIRELPASRVLGVALSPEKQDQQNVVKLKGLTGDRWRGLVDLIHNTNVGELYANPDRIKEFVHLASSDDVQINAIISNMTRVVRELHDPSSQLLRLLKRSLRDGKLCVVDISQMRGSQGLQLAGIVLSDLFQHNQDQFTEANPQAIPTIAVIEEAQSVLGASSNRDDGPFVAWVKEGRKYGLGAVLVTQQPGSIPDELLSQGDNFFVFHLLSQGDLVALRRANAHFSDDLLATLLNEPLVGHGVFWSSAPGTDEDARPYPLPVRVLSFDEMYRIRDAEYTGDTLNNYAASLRREFVEELERAQAAAGGPVQRGAESSTDNGPPVVDAEATYRSAAIAALNKSDAFWSEVRSSDGVRWGVIQRILSESAPNVVEDGFEWAKGVVKEALETLLGRQDMAWTTERRPPGNKVWVRQIGTSPGADASDIEDRGSDEPPF